MKRIAVFCGSASGGHAEYARVAGDLAAELAGRAMGLVYGGGSVGLMGVLADAMLRHGGEVIGVIPRGLASRELSHTGLTELRVVDTMHERKATMAELADGFLALPGGLGTLEETLEVLTWAQLGIHRKPVGLLNVRGYWDALVRLLSHAVAERFVDPASLALLVSDRTARGLLDRLVAWRPPPLPRVWLDATQV